MTNLTTAILEQVLTLDSEQQQQVLEFLQALHANQPSEKTFTPRFDYETWHREIDELHAQLRAQHGPDYRIDTQKLLDEVREDASRLPWW